MKTFGSALDAHKGFGPGFDFARVALAFSVLLWHSGAIVTGDNSFTGDRYYWIWDDAILPMFFGLSGFLIAGSAQRLSLRNFLINRGLRIVPALAVEITLSALVLGPLLTAFPLHEYFTTSSFYIYFFNIFGWVHFHLPGLFLTNPRANLVNSSLWTVPFEFLCYGAMSFLIVTGLVRSGITLLVMAFVFVALGTAYQIGLVPAHGGAGKIMNMVFLNQGSALLPSFLLGAAGYALRYRIPYDVRILVGCVAITAALSVLGDGRLWEIAAFAFVACPIFIYVVLFIGLTPIGKIPFFSRGDYSYGIYLYGYPLQQALMAIFPGLKSVPLHMAASATLATLFATFSWHFIEKPILRVRKNFSFMARKEIIAAEGDRLTGTSPATLGSPVALTSEPT
jgi:peptidoglycan/LPS O-acetylase OafA/YrhL